MAHPSDAAEKGCNLDRPVLLQVTVSRDHCPTCRRYFRAQPPFLCPDAVYTNRVVTKAVQAVHADGMAMRCVGARLARDFWVRPSEGSIRRWCRAVRAGESFVTEYQPWVVEEFSGILCIDEMYQGQFALLLAVIVAVVIPDELELADDEATALVSTIQSIANVVEGLAFMELHVARHLRLYYFDGHRTHHSSGRRRNASRSLIVA